MVSGGDGDGDGDGDGACTCLFFGYSKNIQWGWAWGVRLSITNYPLHRTINIKRNYKLNIYAL